MALVVTPRTPLKLIESLLSGKEQNAKSLLLLVLMCATQFMRVVMTTVPKLQMLISTQPNALIMGDHKLNSVFGLQVYA